MAIIVESASLSNALKQISQITGAKQAQVVMNKKTINVQAMEKDIFLSIVVNGEVPGKDAGFQKFTFDIGIMTGIIHKTEKLTFTYDVKNEKKPPNKVLFESAGKGKKYKGDFLVMPEGENTAIESMSLDDAQWSAFPASSLEVISGMIPRVSITDMQNNSDMLLHVRVNKEGVTLACFDNYHSAFFHVQEKIKGKLNMVIPMYSYVWLEGLSQKQTFDLAVSGSMLCAKNDWFMITMPIQQIPEDLSMGIVEDFIKGLPKKPDSYAVFVRSELTDILERLNSLYENGVGVSFSAGKNDTMTIKYSTSYGKITSDISTVKSKFKSDKSEYKFDLNLLWDLVRASGDEQIKINLIDGKFMYIDSSEEDKKRFYICPLVA